MEIAPISSSASSSKTTLSDLPEEIIILILQYLRPILPLTTFPPRYPPSTSYTTLCHSWTNASPPPWPHPAVSRSFHAFAQVSKRANQLVKPLLYNAIALQTIDITDRLALQLVNEPSSGLLIKHLCIPHDGLMHSPSDRLSSLETWAVSWRIILAAATRLESLFIVTRPGGKALQELLLHTSNHTRGLKYLRRMTISSLSFTLPTLEAGPMHAPGLTHLHLIQYAPPTLRQLFDTSTHLSLRYLRLSRVNMIPFRYLSDMSAKGKYGGKEIFEKSEYGQHQPLLALLRECIERCPHLQSVLLEVNEQANLDMPEELTPFNNECSASDWTAPQLEWQEWPVEGAEKRIAHWSWISDAKTVLQQYSRDLRGPHSPPVDFSIVAPRPGGWDRNESLLEFHANAAACRQEYDQSAFEDEDVFGLVERYPHLGYDFALAPSGKRVAYWTGALPISPSS